VNGRQKTVPGCILCYPTWYHSHLNTITRLPRGRSLVNVYVIYTMKIFADFLLRTLDLHGSITLRAFLASLVSLLQIMFNSEMYKMYTWKKGGAGYKRSWNFIAEKGNWRRIIEISPNNESAWIDSVSC